MELEFTVLVPKGTTWNRLYTWGLLSFEFEFVTSNNSFSHIENLSVVYLRLDALKMKIDGTYQSK